MFINESLLKAEESLFLCVDLQTKILKAMYYKEDIINNVNILLKAADILGIKVMATEQYPKGLGNTDESININQNKIFPKMNFSVFGCEEFVKELSSNQNIRNLIIFGIETHVCLYQSVKHAVYYGYNVYVLEDICSSRTKRNHEIGMSAIKELGAKIISTEMAIFMHVASASFEKFRELNSLLK